MPSTTSPNAPATQVRVAVARAFGYSDEQIVDVVGLVELQLQPRRRDPSSHVREEHRMSTPYLAWAAAVGAAGCGRCATAGAR